MKKVKKRENQKNEKKDQTLDRDENYDSVHTTNNQKLNYVEHSLDALNQQNSPSKRFPSITIPIIFILLGILLGILFSYGGNPLVSLVNGQPIFRWELANILLNQYGRQALEGMILERLVNDEAKKLNVQVTQDDIDKKLQQILQQFGGDMKVEDFLKFQGMQKEDFDNQIRLQLIVEKLLSKDIKITDDDIARYIATNQARLVATDSVNLREEAKSAILQEKITGKLRTWLEELKGRANIQNFF